MTAATEALARLHTRLLDASEGYEEGLELADKPNVRALFEELLELRRRQAGELAAALTARGAEADENGSFLQYVHKAILNVRSALTGLGDNVIPGLRDGEKRLLELFDAARGAAAGDPALLELLDLQRAETASKIALMREMEQAAEA